MLWQCPSAFRFWAIRFVKLVAIALRAPTNLELQLNGSIECLHSFDSYRSHSTSYYRNWGTLDVRIPEFCTSWLVVEDFFKPLMLVLSISLLAYQKSALFSS